MWKWLEVETENVPNSLLDIENVNRGKDKHSEKLWFYFLGIAISNNYLENFLNFVLNYTYFNCRGPGFLKRGKCKILRIAKLCRQRHFSRKHYQPYKESTHARSFPFCIRAALLICQSEAVASSKRKKGRGGDRAASSGKAQSQNHPGVCEPLCSSAWARCNRSLTRPGDHSAGFPRSGEIFFLPRQEEAIWEWEPGCLLKYFPCYNISPLTQLDLSTERSFYPCNLNERNKQRNHFFWSWQYI